VTAASEILPAEAAIVPTAGASSGTPWLVGRSGRRTRPPKCWWP